MSFSGDEVLRIQYHGVHVVGLQAKTAWGPLPESLLMGKKLAFGSAFSIVGGRLEEIQMISVDDVNIACPCPLTSVCMPLFNGARYVEVAIRSVLAQTYENWELVIVDDGSTDGGDQIAEAFSRQDARIRFFRNAQGLGVVPNWNRSIELARGQFIQPLHQDDLLEAEALAQEVEALQTHPDCTLVIHSVDFVNVAGAQIGRRRLVRKDRRLDARTFGARSLRGRNLYGEPSSSFFRRADWVRVHGYDPDIRYCPDWDFALRLGKLGDIYALADTLGFLLDRQRGAFMCTMGDRWWRTV